MFYIEGSTIAGILSSTQIICLILCHRGVWFTGCQLAKSSFFLYPKDVWHCLYHLLEYYKQEIWRKHEVGHLLFSLIDFSSFLELLPPSCGPFIFPPFILVVVNSFKNGFPLAEPSPTHNSNFPVSAISSNNSPTAG